MTDLEWALLAERSSNLEAEQLIAMLAARGIPALLKSEATGVFGPGFSGSFAGGTRIYVPSSALAEARELIGEETDEE